MSDRRGREDRAAAAKAARAVEDIRIRRRWITLGEVLAVIAVVISALTLWNSWTERSTTEAVKHADARAASARAGTLVLTGANSGNSKLILKPTIADQSVQSQTISFPTALGVKPAETTGEPRIEASWFEHALKNARGRAHLPDDSRGDERLPVAITTHFLANGEPRQDIAVYDIGYGITGHWLGGHSVALRGVSLVSRASSGSAQATIDARWTGLVARK